MKVLNFIGLIGLVFCSQSLFAQTSKELQEHWWHPFSGSIEEIHQYNNTLYYGGNFNYIGPNNRNGGILDLSDDLNPLPFTARPNGLVDKVIADGAGGWFIAGNFTSIGTSPRQGVARINRDGSLHPWAPAFNGKVRELLLHQGVLYAGGEFNQIGTTLRNRVCAFDSIGNLLPWNPSSNGTVNTFKIFQDKLLVGGNFTNIGGVNRNRLAELNLQNGNAGPLSIVINGEIRALEVVGSRIYIGGDFNGVNGASANVGKLACYDYLLGGFTNFNVSFNNNVYSLHFNLGFLYVGGIFTTVNSQTRISAVALDTTGVGLVTGINFFLDAGSGVVNSITSINDVVYLGGVFARGDDYGITAYSYYQSGFLPSKTPKVTNFGSVMSMAVSGDRFYLGGNFTSIGGANNYGIAAIDMTTGRLKKGNISKFLVGSVIRDFEPKDSLLYFSGNFTISSQSGNFSNDVAIYNMKTDSFIDLNIDATGNVFKVKLDSNILYLGGDFTVINTLPRLDFAAINLTTKSLEPLAVNVNGNIEEIEISGDTLFVGGSFSSVGGISRSNLASFNKNTGAVHAWNPNVNNRVRTMALSGSLLYIAGDFTQVSSTSRSRLAAVNRSTGVLSAWNPGANQQIFKIRVYDNLLYVLGSFTTIKSQSRSYAVAFNLINDSLIALPTFNNSVYEVYIDPLLTCYGGFFSVTNNVSISIGAFMNPCKAFISSIFRAPICTNDQVVLNAPINRNAKYQWLSGNNIPLTDKKDYLLSITSPGTYKVVMQNDTFACADTSAAISINYLERSFANLTPNKDTVFCRNTPFVLSVDSSALVNGIDWYRGNSKLNVNTKVAPVGNSSGNYYAIVSNVNGCKDTSKVINVNIPTNPSVGFPQGKSSICDNDSVLLTVFRLSPSHSYSWLLNGQLIPNALDTFTFAKDSGFYAVRVVSVEGCIGTSSGKKIKKGLSPVLVIADSSHVGFCDGSTLTLFDKDSATNRMGSYRWMTNGFITSNTKPLITTVNEATFRLIGTNKEGCTDTSNLVTTIAYPKPPPIYILGETNAILNSTYNYSVENTPGSVYRWTPINGTQLSGAQTASVNMRWTVVGNAELAVVETNRFGCNGDTAKSDITVVIPSLSLNRTSLTLNSDFGEMGFVSVSSNANWTVTEGATWLSVDKTSGAGNEDVMFITDQPNNTGAIRSTTVVFRAGQLAVNLLVTQSSSTGINEPSKQLRIAVYPNPSNDFIYVKTNLAEAGVIEVYKIDGTKVFETTVNANAAVSSFDLSPFAAGLYFVKIKSGSELLVQKVWVK